MAMDGRRVEVVEAVEVSIRGLGFEFLSCVGMLTHPILYSRHGVLNFDG